MIKAGIVGATGYGGCELVRFLLTHKEVEIKWVSSRTYTDEEYIVQFLVDILMS